MFPKIRQVNGRAITVESTAAGLRAALATGAERLVGTLKNCSVITGTWRVRPGKKGRLVRPQPLPHPPRLRLGLLRHPLLVRCLLELPRRLLGLLPSLSEVDKIHDSDQTALLRTALALFENCDLPPGVLDEILRIDPRRGKRQKFLGNKLC